MRGTPAFTINFVFMVCQSFIRLPRYQAALFAFVLNYAAYLLKFWGGFNRLIKVNLRQHKFCTESLADNTKIVIPRWSKSCCHQSVTKSSIWLGFIIGLRNWFGDLLDNVAMARDVTLVPLVLVGVIYLFLISICAFILSGLKSTFLITSRVRWNNVRSKEHARINNRQFWRIFLSL